MPAVLVMDCEWLHKRRRFSLVVELQSRSSLRFQARGAGFSFQVIPAFTS